MRMEQVFSNIVKVMHYDYAGCEDKKGWDQPKAFTSKVREVENREDFVEVVRDYLLDFDDQHLFFLDEKQSRRETKKDVGFRVRRYEDRLYVTSVYEANILKIGTYFRSLDGERILDSRNKYERYLNEHHPEREDWTFILQQCKTAEAVTPNGEVFQYNFTHYEQNHRPPTYAVQEVMNDIVLLTFTDFMNAESIAQLVENQRKLLERSNNWIIDVRTNGGGSTSSFASLLPYMLPEKGIAVDSTFHEMSFNFTEASAKRQLASIEQMLVQEKNLETIDLLKRYEAMWQEHRGTGFAMSSLHAKPDLFKKGTATPKQIFVLTDVYCGSAGDAFVELAKLSPKVTVVGRPTKGLNDYSNVVRAEWDGFALYYPTSRLMRIDNGQGMSKVGISPNHYIPWTPQHLYEDVDLTYVFNKLTANKKNLVKQ
ncbi:S41 family peptidase [Shouchella sp. JSM 1781072]|uniref:S41 family peptidase n=1 Tax=Bacillaceae TaxID=186817 RepID=UPI0020D0803F|nr:S41 family peptidase [Alkalihalobacillus sp. LMS6]UTR07365.1 S41 family peptidase [Alkalihalobacillus sp. LMS6]